MFPVSDVIPSRATPIVTLGLIALSSIVFLCELPLDAIRLQAFVNRLGVIPAAFAWPALLTGPLLHIGWIHLGLNLLCLWIFGANVEDAFGRGRFLLFYVACGALAGGAYVAAHPWSAVPMIGASGAVAGVMGAYLVLYPRSRVLTVVVAILYLDLIEIPAVFFVGLWFLFQLFSGVGSIGAVAADGAHAFTAQIAGFVTGAICGALARFAGASLGRYWR